MSPYSKGRPRTVGVSPKVSVPSALLAAVGVVLLVLDQAGVVSVDDSLWLGVLGASGVTFGSGFAASPGRVRGERGLSLLEVLVLLLLVLVVLMLVGVIR